MMWLAIAFGVVLGAFCLFLAGGLLHMRHSIRTAEAAVAKVEIREIPALRDECVRVFREAFDEGLDLDDYEASALALSGRLDDSAALKEAFARDDFYWYFVLPVGAFIGELLRVHLNGTWRPASGDLDGLALTIPVGDESAETFPFHKAIKHVTTGDPGDVYAYFMASRELEKITERLDADGDPAA